MSSRRRRTRPSPPSRRRSRTGYRHIDTAAAYVNEREVGEAIRRSGLDRAEVFIETKVWISDYGYDQTLHAFDKSAGKLGVDQIDLLILHQALPGEFDLTLDAYKALETLLADGKVRAIGVSNFMPDHLARLLDETSVVPAVNQIEVHPYFRQSELLGGGRRARHPLPGVVADRRHHLLPRRQRTAAPSRTRPSARSPPHTARRPAQVMLRWHLQQGRSGHPEVRQARRGSPRTSTSSTSSSPPRSSPPSTRSTPASAAGRSRRSSPAETFGREIPEA